jgi:hypothetical protein
MCGLLFIAALNLTAPAAFTQIDPFQQNLLQLGYDQPASRQGPHGIYAYYYNNPEVCGINVGHKVSLATIIGGSADPDRFNPWRLGGVLPLIAKFPLILPGYFYQDLTAKRFTPSIRLPRPPTL